MTSSIENDVKNGDLHRSKSMPNERNGQPIVRSQSAPEMSWTMIIYDENSPYNAISKLLFEDSEKDFESKYLESVTTDRTIEQSEGVPLGITGDNMDSYTYYELFGIPDAESFDLKHLKKVYHKACLVYHPDKRKGAQKDTVEDNRVFLRLQEAFSTLSDDDKRRQYDSQLPFDESTPTESQVEKKMKKNLNSFYTIFEPVFRRNARFAVKKPVPSLGDEKTPIEEVFRFYEYWVHFESWRDFSGVEAEYNPEEATCREEKRWMQKENEKAGKKLKKKEMDRIIEFVTLAQRKDPRILADKEAKRLAKEAEKLAKEAEERKKIEEAIRAAEAAALEEQEAREAAAANKQDKEKMKKIMSKARNIIRKLLRHTAVLGLGDGAYGIFTDEEQEFLCSNSTLEQLNQMNDAMGGEPATKDFSLFLESGVDFVKETFIQVRERRNHELAEEKKAKEAAKRQSTESASGKSTDSKSAESIREWSREHLSMLAKGVAKYPAGQSNRWELITKFMNDSIRSSVPFTQDECVKAAFNAAKNMQSIKKK